MFPIQAKGTLLATLIIEGQTKSGSPKASFHLVATVKRRATGILRFLILTWNDSDHKDYNRQVLVHLGQYGNRTIAAFEDRVFEASADAISVYLQGLLDDNPNPIFEVVQVKVTLPKLSKETSDALVQEMNALIGAETAAGGTFHAITRYEQMRGGGFRVGETTQERLLANAIRSETAKNEYSALPSGLAWIVAVVKVIKDQLTAGDSNQP